MDGMSTSEPDPVDIARTLRRYATRHVAQPWNLTTDLGDLRAVRRAGDYSGYERPDRRLRRALTATVRPYIRPSGLDRMMGAGRYEHSGLGRNPLRHVIVMLNWTRATLRANLRTPRHLPDARLENAGILTWWFEDGYYVQMMQRSTGELIADFLEAEPTNPHAIAIAAEIGRINRDYDERAAAASAEHRRRLAEYTPSRIARLAEWAYRTEKS